MDFEVALSRTRISWPSSEDVSPKNNNNNENTLGISILRTGKIDAKIYINDLFWIVLIN